MRYRHRVLGFLCLLSALTYLDRIAIYHVLLVMRFLFSVSFGYFIKWFGSYDLALLPVALMLATVAVMWLRIDATEELIPERVMPAPSDCVAAVVG